jgi:hypothetical protein
MVAILDAQNMSDWNKDLSSCIWPWREPVLGVALVFGGVRTILTHKFHDRTWAYHGFTADFAGIFKAVGCGSALSRPHLAKTGLAYLDCFR